MRFFEFSRGLQAGWSVDRRQGTPAVILGETGRGRALVRIPLAGHTSPPHPCPGRPAAGRPGAVLGIVEGIALHFPGCPDCGETGYRRPDGAIVHPDRGMVLPIAPDRVMGGTLARSGRVWSIIDGAAEGAAVGLIIRDQSGFRGGWSLRGVRTPCPGSGHIPATWAYRDLLSGVAEEARAPGAVYEAAGFVGDERRFPRPLTTVYPVDSEYRRGGACPCCGWESPAYGDERWDGTVPAHFRFTPAPAPLAEGRCAQGDAGRAGGGAELVVVLRPGEEVWIHRSGRLYGAPADIRLRVGEAGDLTAMTLEEVREEMARTSAPEEVMS